jgi:hypothetical protein
MLILFFLIVVAFIFLVIVANIYYRKVNKYRNLTDEEKCQEWLDNQW